MALLGELPQWLRLGTWSHQAWLNPFLFSVQESGLSYQLGGHQEETDKMPVCTLSRHTVWPGTFHIFPSLTSGRPKDSHSLARVCFPIYPVVQAVAANTTEDGWSLLLAGMEEAKTWWRGGQPRPTPPPPTCQQGLPRQLLTQPHLVSAGITVRGREQNDHRVDHVLASSRGHGDQLRLWHSRGPGSRLVPSAAVSPCLLESRESPTPVGVGGVMMMLGTLRCLSFNTGASSWLLLLLLTHILKPEGDRT